MRRKTLSSLLLSAVLLLGTGGLGLAGETVPGTDDLVPGRKGDETRTNTDCTDSSPDQDGDGVPDCRQRRDQDQDNDKPVEPVQPRQPVLTQELVDKVKTLAAPKLYFAIQRALNGYGRAGPPATVIAASFSEVDHRFRPEKWGRQRDNYYKFEIRDGSQVANLLDALEQAVNETDEDKLDDDWGICCDVITKMEKLRDYSNDKLPGVTVKLDEDSWDDFGAQGALYANVTEFQQARQQAGNAPPQLVLMRAASNIKLRRQITKVYGQAHDALAELREAMTESGTMLKSLALYIEDLNNGVPEGAPNPVPLEAWRDGQAVDLEPYEDVLEAGNGNANKKRYNDLDIARSSGGWDWNSMDPHEASFYESGWLVDEVWGSMVWAGPPRTVVYPFGPEDSGGANPELIASGTGGGDSTVASCGGVLGVGGTGDCTHGTGTTGTGTTGTGTTGTGTTGTNIPGMTTVGSAGTGTSGTGTVTHSGGGTRTVRIRRPPTAAEARYQAQSEAALFQMLQQTNRQCANNPDPNCGRTQGLAAVLLAIGNTRAQQYDEVTVANPRSTNQSWLTGQGGSGTTGTGTTGTGTTGTGTTGTGTGTTGSGTDGQVTASLGQMLADGRTNDSLRQYGLDGSVSAAELATKLTVEEASKGRQAYEHWFDGIMTQLSEDIVGGSNNVGGLSGVYVSLPQATQQQLAVEWSEYSAAHSAVMRKLEVMRQQTNQTPQARQRSVEELLTLTATLQAKAKALEDKARALAAQAESGEGGK